MTPRTRKCTPAIVSGRRRKAEQFADAFATILEFADEPGDVSDACATLAVHAGIAATDVICCAFLGRHHQGEDHRGAIDLLASVDSRLARHMKTLLDLKTLAGYSHDTITLAALKKAGRAMTALVDAARRAQ
ncbi:MAG: hypothetical protein HQ453_03235 [Actinobacteria bacterium]|nr:hypothetical protein [Actinomycetota bacterium]